MTATRSQAGADARRGFLLCTRNGNALELLKANNCAFVLLFVIAYRARWHEGFNSHELEVGEALIGDYRACGMSHRQYRTAVEQLRKWGFATFTPTSKGTIAKIVDSSVFDIRPYPTDNQKDNQPTNDRQTGDKQPTNNTDCTDGTDGTDGGVPPKPPSELARMICRWFHRRESTVWDTKEVKALRAVEAKHTPEDEIALLGEYYVADLPRDVKDIRRRDIVTLLNNWQGEIDRARDWKANPGRNANHVCITPQQRKANLQELIEKHCCNKNSLGYRDDATDEQWAEYGKLKADLVAVTRVLANGGAR